MVMVAGSANLRLSAVLAVGLLLSGCASQNDANNVQAQVTERRAASPDDRTTVVVTENGLRSAEVSGDETVADCAAFRLTPVQVSDYFARARSVDARTYGHDLDMSRCRAVGTIRSADGSDSSWMIDEARRGHVARTNGAHHYFFCADCPAPPFFKIDPADE